MRGGGGKFGPEGAAGTIRLVGDQLECIADGHDMSAGPKDSEDRKAIKDAAYAEYDERLRHRWRMAR